MPEIGFGRRWIPKTEKLQKQVGDLTVEFSKEENPEGQFLYKFKSLPSGSGRSFYSEINFPIEELEKLPQFAEFTKPCNAME